MYLNIIGIIVLIILIILVILCLNNNKSQNDNYDDYLFHMSSETETTLRALNNILTYDKNFTFISLNQVYSKIVYDNGIAKFDIPDILNYSPFNNYRNHFIQGFTEIKENDNYLSHKYSTPLGKPIKIAGVNGNKAYIMQFERLTDKVKFYYIQMTQSFGGYLKDNSYKAISELIQFIIKQYPGEYIITGDFNVQGHEKIFQYFFKEKDYHICSFYQYITCNDNDGVASPDGIIVSKKLYKHVKYNIDIYPGYSYQHFMITAKLYINGPVKTECVIDHKTLLYFEEIIKNRTKSSFVNNAGNFDPNIHLGDINNIKEVPLEKSSSVTYITQKMTEKIEKIN